MRYYSLPLSATQLMEGTAERDKVGIEESIKQHLDVMLLTWLGAYHHSPSFGSALRLFDFYMPDADINNSIFKTFFPKEGKQILEWHDNVKTVIRNSLENSIIKHESRLFQNIDDLGHKVDFVSIVKKETKRVDLKNEFKKQLKIELIIKVEGHYFENEKKRSFDDFERTFELPTKPPYLRK
ncbi:hypothetical protein [Flavilitoribacter nigricans]|uniref:Uncharacterized protein n=1 Tax=Flavilitoribacter nigricans (strain ATCC 23147 / DSM 23189 / NBRC 102662 / NCIMB 1420 / SS-2) TaxID=1122177 RepID=A0A2D0N9Q5_FLAN2|nr:hypothetical protein [Flavilitoribacter nigricans]PHN05106.1 hypothetical protein CRP01_18975 [Flavilitoribacter nigricans DSM 23189 = NBRC 102662]